MFFCCDRAVAFRVLVRTRLSNRAAILSAPFLRGGRSSDHVRGMVSENFERDCYIDTHACYFRSWWDWCVDREIDPAAAGRTNVSVVAGGDDFVHRDRWLREPTSMVSIASHSDRRPVCRRGVRVCWPENVQPGNENRAFDFAGGLIRFFRVRLCTRFLPTERRFIARRGIGFEANHTGKCTGGRCR